MKQPIEFAPGDVIVHDLGSDTNESTWVRGEDGNWRTGDKHPVVHNDKMAQIWIDGNFGKLIHTAARKPLIKVPTKPTLGRVSFTDESIVGEVWRDEAGKVWLAGAYIGHGDTVTAWEPLTAVPKVALDDLRSYADSLIGSDHATRDTRRVWDFLAAVDKAGEPA